MRGLGYILIKQLRAVCCYGLPFFDFFFSVNKKHGFSILVLLKVEDLYRCRRNKNDFLAKKETALNLTDREK